jgi:hypothetical protein
METCRVKAKNLGRTLLLLCLAFVVTGADSEGGCGGGGQIGEPLLGCSAETCPGGCCYENSCFPGNAANACGGKGTRCQACLGIKTCDTSKACEQDRASFWTVQPIKASIPPEDPRDGLSWDADGSSPDVIVELRCPTQQTDKPLVTRTPEVSSLNPEWREGGCTTLADALLNAPLQIVVIDVDSFFDDNIAAMAHSLTEEEFESGRVVLSLPGYLNSLELQLARVR